MTLALMLLALPATAYAQQTSAHGMSGNMNLMRLENRLKVLEVNNARMQACQQQGMLYLPGSPKADNEGCVDSLDGLELGAVLPSAPTCTYNERTIGMLHNKRVDVNVDSTSDISLKIINHTLVAQYTMNGNYFRTGYSASASCTRTYDGTRFSPCTCHNTYLIGGGRGSGCDPMTGAGCR
jgi:hypothetical protein